MVFLLDIPQNWFHVHLEKKTTIRMKKRVIFCLLVNYTQSLR